MRLHHDVLMTATSADEVLEVVRMGEQAAPG
jgi:hypothetical protein